jgi:arabinogalactan endo-1,4-beta-galactosidase
MMMAMGTLFRASNPVVRGASFTLALLFCDCTSDPGTGEETGATAGVSSVAGKGGSGQSGAAGSAGSGVAGSSGASGGSASGGGAGKASGGAGASSQGGAGSGGANVAGSSAAGTAGSAAGSLSGSGGASAGGAGEGGAGAGAGGSSGTSAGGGLGGASGAGGAGGTGGAPPLPAFLLGADISSVQEARDNGTRYADTDGTEKGILDILKAHGFNTIRLRTFVEPLAEYGYATCTSDEPYCDKDHTIEFGQEIKAAGMSLLLDFHYSDTWADPGKQVIPESWRSANTIEARAALLKAYTVDVLEGMVAAGARPDMVQVGNEITPGMLIHVPSAETDCWGNNSTPASLTGSISNWDNLATLLKAGIDGVREVDPSIKVMLHIENTDDLNGARAWVQNAVSRGVDFDVLGLSCYVEWQGQPSVWRNTFETLAEEFPELSFVVAEYNPERTEANRVMRDLPDGRGLGTFFWEPTQSGAWGQSLFTSTGGVLRANASDFAEFDAIRDELGL